MKWQKLAVIVTAVVAMVATAPMAHSVTLKAQVSGTAVTQGSGNLDKPTKFTTQDIIKACATANDLNASDLTLVIVFNDELDPTGGELWVASKNAVTNLVCDIASVSGRDSSSKCKAGSKSSATKVVFSFDINGAASNAVPDLETLGGFGIAQGSVTTDTIDCGDTGTDIILGATLSGSFGAETDTDIVQGTLKISGKDLE